MIHTYPNGPRYQPNETVTFRINCVCCGVKFARCRLSNEARNVLSQALSLDVQNGHGIIEPQGPNGLQLRFQIRKAIIPTEGFGSFTIFIDGTPAVNSVVCWNPNASKQAWCAFRPHRTFIESHIRSGVSKTMKMPAAPWAAVSRTTTAYDTLQVKWMIPLNDAAGALATTMIAIAKNHKPSC